MESSFLFFLFFFWPFLWYSIKRSVESSSSVHILTVRPGFLDLDSAHIRARNVFALGRLKATEPKRRHHLLFLIHLSVLRQRHWRRIVLLVSFPFSSSSSSSIFVTLSSATTTTTAAELRIPVTAASGVAVVVVAVA